MAWLPVRSLRCIGFTGRFDTRNCCVPKPIALRPPGGGELFEKSVGSDGRVDYRNGIAGSRVMLNEFQGKG